MPHDVRIETYRGSRDKLRALFELAEDSAAELNSYIDTGRVLVAVSGTEVIGHLQLTGTEDPRQAEIKNMAVREARQGQGVGRQLIQAAVDLVAAGPVTTLLVATATADIGNLRFYQRQGFRMRSIERDAFTAATGYPPGLRIDGIELRDRVWLDRAVLSSVRLPVSASSYRRPRGDEHASQGVAGRRRDRDAGEPGVGEQLDRLLLAERGAEPGTPLGQRDGQAVQRAHRVEQRRHRMADVVLEVA